ncbi:MAG: septum formation initiator family protein [Candidatus Aureabacteria bacterium]|nr:septum formation initiator family protein [Candidatus Auribacterota bacterium]
MKILSAFFKRFQIFLAIFLTIASVTTIFLPRFKERSILLEKNAELQAKITLLEKEIQDLHKRKIAFQNNPIHLEKLARDKLGYSKQNEIIYKFD